MFYCSVGERGGEHFFLENIIGLLSEEPDINPAPTEIRVYDYLAKRRLEHHDIGVMRIVVNSGGNLLAFSFNKWIFSERRGSHPIDKFYYLGTTLRKVNIRLSVHNSQHIAVVT